MNKETLFLGTMAVVGIFFICLSFIFIVNDLYSIESKPIIINSGMETVVIIGTKGPLLPMKWKRI